jgi:hypothetical protein
MPINTIITSATNAIVRKRRIRKERSCISSSNSSNTSSTTRSNNNSSKQIPNSFRLSEKKPIAVLLFLHLLVLLFLYVVLTNQYMIATTDN